MNFMRRRTPLFYFSSANFIQSSAACSIVHHFGEDFSPYSLFFHTFWFFPPGGFHARGRAGLPGLCGSASPELTVLAFGVFKWGAVQNAPSFLTLQAERGRWRAFFIPARPQAFSVLTSNRARFATRPVFILRSIPTRRTLSWAAVVPRGPHGPCRAWELGFHRPAFLRAGCLLAVVTADRSDSGSCAFWPGRGLCRPASRGCPNPGRGRASRRRPRFW